MKDHVEIGHLTKYDAFRMNRDQPMNLEIYSKSIQKSLILRKLVSSQLLSISRGITGFYSCHKTDEEFIWFWGTLSQN